MKLGPPISTVGKASPAPKQVLYLGPASGADEMCQLLSAHIGKVEISYQQDVQTTVALVQKQRFDVILVDRRDGNMAVELAVPLFCALPWRPKVVVISTLSKVSDYLGVPGVARVLTAPVRPGQLWRVLDLEAPKRSVGIVEPPPGADAKAEIAAPAPIAAPRKSIVQWLSDHFMNLISIMYKRLAFILLFALFIAFTFYGVLIGFFLLSSGWAAPMTLTRGHMLVDKVEGEITSLKVQINQAEQRLSDVYLAQATSKRELSDADDLVTYVSGTITKEISARKRQEKVFTAAIKRLARVKGQLARELDNSGATENLSDLYKKHLITKSYFSAGNFSLLEAHQRLVGIENDIELQQGQIDDLQASMGMLTTLREALARGHDTTGIVAGAGDLLLLNKQAVDALAAKSDALSKLATAGESEITLERSLAILRQQLTGVQSTALARAINKRIDVLFVPYGNEQMFLSGTPVYACRMTIFFCSKAGVAGAVLPGEITGVHPFFGKNIRGFFVEVHLDSEVAATREIIHGYRKPFFF
jgi:hypothetical protein